MAQDKYRRVGVYNSQTKKSLNIGIKEMGADRIERDYAVFVGPNAETNAEKVTNLLNETSRSQGKYQK